VVYFCAYISNSRSHIEVSRFSGLWTVHILVHWVMTPSCNLIGEYRYFGVACYSHLQVPSSNSKKRCHNPEHDMNFNSTDSSYFKFEEFYLVGYNACNVENQPTFRRNIWPSTEGRRINLVRNLREAGRKICETSVDFQRTGQIYIPEDRNLLNHRC
jgi:hypothetical protein